MKLINKVRQILFKKRYDKNFKRDCVECSFRRYFLVSNKLEDLSFCVQDVENMLRTIACKYICSSCPYKAFFNMIEAKTEMTREQIQYLYVELISKTDYTTASHIDEYTNKINNNLTVL